LLCTIFRLDSCKAEYFFKRNFKKEQMESIQFLDFQLHRPTRQLMQDARKVEIGARAFDLLDLLITHRDRVVSRNEIMESVWRDLIVGDNNLNVQVANLRRALGPQAVVTVPGRGLRFGFKVVPDRAPNTALSLPDRPSVVVLPFADLGGDPDLGWLADGFVEDITTELSRFRDLFVVARNSAFAYRGVPRDVREVSRDLGVRYVVEGSVRAASGRVRVTAQLIDATNGSHVWAENFDSNLQDHFETQHRIAQAVVTSLAPQIDRAEAARIRTAPPDDLNAYGVAQLGWAIISAGDMAYDPVPRDQALTLARQALDIDPDSGLAWRTVAWVQWWHAYHATTPSIPATLAEGLDAANRAIALDPTDHHARRLKALLNFMNQNPDAGLLDLRHAHEINPNCAITLGWLGLYEATHGERAKGVPYAEAALRLSPCDPARGSLLAALGFAQFTARDYDAAVQTAEAALAEAAGSVTPLVLGVIARVGAGQIEKAGATFRKLNEIAPKLTEARLAGRWLSTDPDYQIRAHTFFRIAAGLDDPECAARLR
jgi:TolB-like protein